MILKLKKKGDWIVFSINRESRWTKLNHFMIFLEKFKNWERQFFFTDFNIF